MVTVQLLAVVVCLTGAGGPLAEADAAVQPVAEGPAADGPVAETDAAVRPSTRPSRVTLLGAGVGAALVSAPTALVLGIGLGGLSSNLVLAALPALMVVLALPPLAVTFAMFYVAEALSPGSARVRPAVWSALGAQLVLLVVGAVLFNAHGQNLADAALFTLTQAIILPMAVYPFLLRPEAARAPAPSARRPLPDPARPAARALLSLPVASWRF